MWRGTANFEDPEPDYVIRREPPQYVASSRNTSLDADDAIFESEDNEIDAKDALVTGPWGEDPHSSGGNIATSRQHLDLSAYTSEQLFDGEVIRAGYDDTDLEVSAGTDAEGKVPDNIPKLRARTNYPDQRSGTDMPYQEDGENVRMPKFRLSSAVASTNVATRRMVNMETNGQSEMARVRASKSYEQVAATQIVSVDGVNSIKTRVPRNPIAIGLAQQEIPTLNGMDNVATAVPKRNVVDYNMQQLVPIVDARSELQSQSTEKVRIARRTTPNNNSMQQVDASIASMVSVANVQQHHVPNGGVGKSNHTQTSMQQADIVDVNGDLHITHSNSTHNAIHRPNVTQQSSIMLLPIVDTPTSITNHVQKRTIAPLDSAPLLPLGDASALSLVGRKQSRPTQASSVSSYPLANPETTMVRSPIGSRSLISTGTSSGIQLQPFGSSQLSSLMHPLPRITTTSTTAAAATASVTSTTLLPMHDGHQCTNPAHNHSSNQPSAHNHVSGSLLPIGNGIATQQTHVHNNSAPQQTNNQMLPTMNGHGTQQQLHTNTHNTAQTQQVSQPTTSTDTKQETKPIVRRPNRRAVLQQSSSIAATSATLENGTAASQQHTRQKQAVVFRGGEDVVTEDGEDETVKAKIRPSRASERKSGVDLREDSGSAALAPRSRPIETSQNAQRSGAAGREDKLPTPPVSRRRRENSVSEEQAGNIRVDTRNKSKPTTRPRDAINEGERVAESDVKAATDEKHFRGVNPRTVVFRGDDE